MGAYENFITYRQRCLGQGNSFRSVCQKFCPQGGIPACLACWDTPLWTCWDRSHGTPLARRPPSKETPPARRPSYQGDPPAGRPHLARRPPCLAKETPLQAHTWGGNWGGSGPGPGPQPRGKLRGIRSRPTPKGEIEGDQIQAHTQGGNWGGSDTGPHPRGKLRGVRSRPISKGEIQWDQDQTNPPPEQLLLRAVRILPECMLVFIYLKLCRKNCDIWR